MKLFTGQKVGRFTLVEVINENKIRVVDGDVSIDEVVRWNKVLKPGYGDRTDYGFLPGRVLKPGQSDYDEFVNSLN